MRHIPSRHSCRPMQRAAPGCGHWRQWSLATFIRSTISGCSATCLGRLGRTKRRSRHGTIIGSPRGSARWGGCSSLAAGSSAGDLGLVQDAMRQVESSYVVPVGPDKLVNGALKGMLSKLDPHSDYMTETEYRELMATTSGQFGGIGIEVSVEEGVPQVVSAIEGTPAGAAGIEPGDRIVKADGVAIVGMDIGEVVRRLRGPPGSRVVLTIARTNRPPFDVPLTRAIIRVQSVKSMLKPGRIGDVRISTFDETTPTELRRAIARMRQQAGGAFAGFVLDLRNDAGGLLDAAVDVASEFLHSGTAGTTRGRGSSEKRVYDAPPHRHLVRGTPLVVVVT